MIRTKPDPATQAMADEFMRHIKALRKRVRALEMRIRSVEAGKHEKQD